MIWSPSIYQVVVACNKEYKIIETITIYKIKNQNGSKTG